MSDYGFATYYDRGKNRVKGVINSKWPIFGPMYSDIKKAFKTIHITDTYQQDYVNSSNVRLPDAPGGGQGYGYAELRDNGTIRNLVATIPHGYGYRPVGYIQFSGVVRQNTRCKWKYDNVVDYYSSFLPSMSPIYNLSSEDVGYTSAPGFIYPLNGSGGYIRGYGEFRINYPDNVYYYLKNPYGLWVVDMFSQGFSGFSPYEVEIDDKNIYIYRNTYWVDNYGRYFSYSDYYKRVVSDYRARSQGVMDWAGSEIDLTIYLCPYKMEDLV